MILNPSFIFASWEVYLRKNAESLEVITPVHTIEKAEQNENQCFFFFTFLDLSKNWVAKQIATQNWKRQEIQSHGQDILPGAEAAITIKE